jgi:hypothetical protein
MVEMQKADSSREPDFWGCGVLKEMNLHTGNAVLVFIDVINEWLSSASRLLAAHAPSVFGERMANRIALSLLRCILESA